MGDNKLDRMRIMLKRSYCFVFAMMWISSFTFAQKRVNLELVAKPGIAFVSGPWRVYSPSILPARMEKRLTPSLDAGVKAVISFKSKKGGKVAYDEMYQSGFYLADKISFNLGVLYSFCGQNYKDLLIGDDTWARKLRLQYVKVPFNFDFIKGKESQTQLIYTAGLYAGYLTWFKEASSATHNKNEQSILIKSNSMVLTSFDGASKQYDLTDRPYQSFDYGLSLGVGMQKKIASDLAVKIMIDGQIGFPNILNTSVQYNDGTMMVPYFVKNENSILPHKNRSFGVMVGLKKTFEWTPAPEEEKKRWRIFRLKK